MPQITPSGAWTRVELGPEIGTEHRRHRGADPRRAARGLEHHPRVVGRQSRRVGDRSPQQHAADRGAARRGAPTIAPQVVTARPSRWPAADAQQRAAEARTPPEPTSTRRRTSSGRDAASCERHRAAERVADQVERRAGALGERARERERGALEIEPGRRPATTRRTRAGRGRARGDPRRARASRAATRRGWRRPRAAARAAGTGSGLVDRDHRVGTASGHPCSPVRNTMRTSRPPKCRSVNRTAAARDVARGRLVVCDVALFYAERSGGIRTYLNEKARFAADDGRVRASPRDAGQARVPPGGRHELRSLQLAASNGYRVPLGGRAVTGDAESDQAGRRDPPRPVLAAAQRHARGPPARRRGRRRAPRLAGACTPPGSRVPTRSTCRRCGASTSTPTSTSTR